MESYVQASLNLNFVSNGSNSAEKKGKRSVNAKSEVFHDTQGNRVGGERKFFNHFLFWGNFAVSGFGGKVHDPEVIVEEEYEGFKKLHVAQEVEEDSELDNIAF